jgi:hypothetical protein
LVTVESFLVSSILNVTSSVNQVLTTPTISSPTISSPTISSPIFSGNVGIGTTSPSAKLQTAVSRTSGTNTTALILSDNVTGIQTSGYGTQIQGWSNNGNAVSAIGFVADGGTNNDTGIAFYTQATAGGLTKRSTIDKFGNFVFNNPDSGIIFDSGSAISTSTLNDYETGTWTPAIAGATIINSVGIYTKIGRLVQFQGRIYWSSISGTTNVISGLPFTTISTGNEATYTMSVTPYVNSGFGSLPSGYGYINGYIISSSITFTWQPNSSNANFASGGNIYISGYYTASF